MSMTHKVLPSPVEPRDASQKPPFMSPVIPSQLYRTSRPGYSGGGRIPVTIGQVNLWVESAHALGIASIICLLSEEHLCLYPAPGLVAAYRAAGFQVRHIPAIDHSNPPLTTGQLAAVLSAWRELPKPVLIHCSAGLGRTGVAVAHICENSYQP